MTETKVASLYDAYLEYRVNDQTNYHTQQGTITFFECDKDKTKHVVIYYIEVDKKLRNQGILSDFVTSLMDNKGIEAISFCGVGSYILDYYLSKKGFYCYGGDFIWYRDNSKHRSGKYQNYTQLAQAGLTKYFKAVWGLDEDATKLILMR